MLPDVAYELQERIFLHPVIIIDHNSLVPSFRTEIKESGQLFFYTFLITVKSGFIQKITFLRSS